MHATSTAATQAPPSKRFNWLSADIRAQPPPKDSLLFNQRDGLEVAGEGSLLRYDKKGKGRAQHNGDILAMDLISAEEGTPNQNGGAFMQMQLMEQQVSEKWCDTSNLRLISFILQDGYIQSRSTAIESIESTIAELGQIFTQLAQMVAEQRETVQRIDADTVDIAANVSGAQRELLKYYASISSNRWLMLKVFGVLIVFVSFLP